MTVAELMALLEGCHCRSEVRLAVVVEGGAPVELAIAGITSSNRLPPAEHVPGQGDPEPDVVWVLGGQPLGTVTAEHWDPRYRRRP
jgi:hypothetical protein